MTSVIVSNRYRIEEKIGSGAVGQVYRAYDREAERFVALKTIPANAQDETIQRFLREAKVTAELLKHPNVVDVYEYGQDGGKLFIAMELLDGTDLRRLIKWNPPIQLVDKVTMMIGICEGVGFAHSKSIVHRDLAPANIHILANQQIKIMDFGLVRLAQSDMTRTGAIMGTPSYMSPEQAEGKKVDASADVFSLGAVFYEFLTGRKAFAADSILSTLFLILNEDYEPIEDFAPDVPNALIEVVDKSLVKSAKDRFPDANALRDALVEVRDQLGEASASVSESGSDAARASSPAAAGAGAGALPDDPALEKTIQLAGTLALDDEPRGFTSLAGSLKKTGVAIVLRYCADNAKVGALHLRRGPIEKRLYFVGGRLLSTTTNSPRETLGQLLIRIGCLTEERLRESLIQQEGSGEPLGRIVVGKGWLSDDRLRELLREKSEESIYDCFLWPDGEFAFEDGCTPEHVYLSENLDVASLIFEGERRARRWKQIRERFPSAFTTFSRAPAASGEAETDEEDRRFLELVARGRNLAEIALEVHGTEFHVASRALELLEKGFIEIKEAPDAPSYEERVRELRKLLRVGLTHFNAGEDDEALTAFEAALAIDPQSKAYLYTQKIKQRKRATEPEEPLDLDGVPRLAVSAERLEAMKLTPEEYFVLSRVNGDWSFGAILQICPMTEEDAKTIFERLLKSDVLTVGGEVASHPES